MKLSVILPSLFPSLAKRAIDSLRKHGTDIELEIVVCGPHRPTGNDILYLPETEPTGLCAAQARCFAAASGDLCMLMTDDAYFVPNWLNAAISTFLRWSRDWPRDRFVMGFQHHASILGTCFGHYYANFPIFWREAGENNDLGPIYLYSQWSDVSLSMSILEKGGMIKRFSEQVVFQQDRGDTPQAKWKPGQDGDVFGKDTRGFMQRFRDTMAIGWPLDPVWWRAINIDALPNILRDDTCRVHSFHAFMELIRIPPDGIDWVCQECGTTSHDRMTFPMDCAMKAVLAV